MKQRSESPLKAFPIDDVLKLRRFWNTRRAVQSGEKLWLLSADEIERRKLMGPWSFNVYESTLAGLPTAAMVWMLTLIGKINTLPANAPLELQMMEKLTDYSQGFVIPLATLLAAQITAFGALAKADNTRARRAVAKPAYLYLDGAYGLSLQAATSVAFLIFSLFPMLGILWSLAGTMLVAYERREVGARLLEEMGYDASDIPSVWSWGWMWQRADWVTLDESERLWRPRAPWRRYVFTTTYAVPITVLLALTLLFLFLWPIAVALASLKRL